MILNMRILTILLLAAAALTFAGCAGADDEVTVWSVHRTRPPPMLKGLPPRPPGLKAPRKSPGRCRSGR